MKKKKYTWALIPMLLLAVQVSAQEATTQLPTSLHREHVLVGHESATKQETLSGLNLKHAKNGTFLLDFEQELQEDATLEIKNTAGQLVFRTPVSATANQHAWRYNVGRLQPDTYLVEVKTDDITYWTRFKIGK